ncbi:hypothetical protein QYE76_045844 [Lolium multiflorum]|uniref:Pectinesterase inhibitor domain-containing protein n=1 Tax=Lolium multiflorum TaxID=4521 RepID=A0AAD8TM75_LOLMU|nr:putative invertase inhibitor [Lolium perenne]KAK1684996.1 hypothetical protein QYE76_045844 [Lolium multiflorum]
MRPSHGPSYIVLFLLATSSCSASILEDACKTFSAARPDIGYGYCIEFFQANKDSTTADKRGLATIATNIARATAMNTRKLSAALRNMVKDQKTRECLGDCAVLYYGIVGRLDEAAKGITSGRSQGLQDAVWSLSAALNVPETCEEGFRKLGGKSTLAAADSEFSKEVSIALVLARTLSR